MTELLPSPPPLALGVRQSLDPWVGFLPSPARERRELEPLVELGLTWEKLSYHKRTRFS